MGLEKPIRIYAGQYYDAETGLHYNYHRYYDPSTGRYLTPDPIGLDGGINLFAYAGNNSTNFNDPYGLFQRGYYTPADVQVILEGGKNVLVKTGGGGTIAYIMMKASQFGPTAGAVAVGGAAGLYAYYKLDDALKFYGLDIALTWWGEQAYDVFHSQDGSDVKKLQWHHDLPQKFRYWFEDDSRGLNIDDQEYGRCVEGGPVGNHQKWSYQFNKDWENFRENNPNGTRDQTIEFMRALRNDPRYQ